MVCQIVYPGDGIPLKEMMGLEDFLQKLKLHLMDSENEKKSVFLKNSVASGNYTVGHTQDFEKDFGYSLEGSF